MSTWNWNEPTRYESKITQHFDGFSVSFRLTSGWWGWYILGGFPSWFCLPRSPGYKELFESLEEAASYRDKQLERMHFIPRVVEP